MAKPINHDFASGTATAGWGAVKGGIAGFLISALVGGLLAAGAIALIGTVGIGIGGLVTGLFSSAGASAAAATAGVQGASMFSGLGGLVTAIAGGVGALAGAANGTWIGGIGAALGLMGGAHKVSREKGAFVRSVERSANMQGATQNNAAMAAMQQGYLMGHQEGRGIGQQEGAEHVVNQLRQAAQEQMLMTQALKAHGGHVTKVCKERELQASAEKQV